MDSSVSSKYKTWKLEKQQSYDMVAAKWGINWLLVIQTRLIRPGTNDKSIRFTDSSMQYQSIAVKYGIDLDTFCIAMESKDRKTNKAALEEYIATLDQAQVDYRLASSQKRKRNDPNPAKTPKLRKHHEVFSMTLKTRTPLILSSSPVIERIAASQPSLGATRATRRSPRLLDNRISSACKGQPEYDQPVNFQAFIDAYSNMMEQHICMLQGMGEELVVEQKRMREFFGRRQVDV
ncbi:hypothetical protein J1614_012285 [Plenodomus biglobosus]|nr:hypothetical protein J1614_012285 [Plenodomus biglobosus]